MGINDVPPSALVFGKKQVAEDGSSLDGVPLDSKPTDGVDVTIHTTVAVARHIDTLVTTGLYGKTFEEVAEELMRARLRELLDRTFAKTERP